MTANLSTLRYLKAAVLFGVALICSAQITDATKSDPTAYLNRVLDIVQARALNKDQIDWPRLRKEALDRAAGAELTVDTYAAIRFAVGALGDHHGSFHPTPDLEALEARRHPVKPEPSEPDASSPFVGRYEPEGRLVQFDGKTFGLVVVPKCFPESPREFVAFETALQKILKDLSEVGPTGWIVDLRGNVGGNMWPMLAGIGPLLGEGDHLGEFFTTSGHSLWKYRDGVASEIENGKEDRNPSVAGSAYKMTGTPKVAVLIDRRTGSSGEAIGVAFRGRSRTRFFGERTQGASTVNDTIKLSDGAALWLTTGVQADRTGKQYLNGFEPDEEVPLGSKILPDDQDPVVRAAVRWLGLP